MTDLQAEASRVIEEITRDAVKYFEASIERRGMVLTDELKNSFRYNIIATSGDLLASAEIEFSGYGRYKDLKTMRYSSPTNLDAMEEFVKKIGVGNFAFVPGYEKSKKIPTANMAVKRIASGIAWHRYNITTVNNSESKLWYTKTLNSFVSVSRRKMMEVLGPYLLENMKGSFEAE